MIQRIIDAYRMANNAACAINCAPTAHQSGSHHYRDPKACAECVARGVKVCAAGDEYKVLALRASRDFFVVDFERALGEFNGLKCEFKRGRCDLAIYDKDRLAFAELTCSASVYIDKDVNGKRSKARSQLSNVINRLAQVPQIAQMFSQLSSRTALFAARRKDAPHAPISSQQTAALNGMLAFQRPAPQAQAGLHQDLGNGFRFVEVNFPAVFTFS